MFFRITRNFQAVVQEQFGAKLCWKVSLQEQDTPALNLPINLPLGSSKCTV